MGGAGCQQSLGASFFCRGQQQIAQLQRVLDAHTTGAERPWAFVEQRLARRVVQVDRERVGETDDHLAQRIARAGVLTQEDVAGVVPVDVRRRQRLAVGVEHLQVLAAEEGLVLADFRQLVFFPDGRRYGPGRIQRQAGDAGFEQRRLAFGAADLGAGLPHRLTALIQRQLSGGHVDHQTAGFHVLGNPAETFEIDAQLIAAGQRADVQLGNGARPDHAVSLQRMTGLKVLHRFHQHVIVGVVRCHQCVCQITFVVQTTGQFRHARVFHRRTQQRAVAHRLPLRQGLQALRGVQLTQALILRQMRTRQVERRSNIVHARHGNAEQLRLTVGRRAVDTPQRFEMRLQQTAVMQILQGLQVVAADVDIGAQLAILRRCRRDRIAIRIQPIIGQQLQLRAQCRQACRLTRPHRHPVLLFIKRLQLAQRRAIETRSNGRARLRQADQNRLQRAARLDRQLRFRRRQGFERGQRLIGASDKRRSEQTNAQVACVLFEQLLYSNPWPSR